MINLDERRLDGYGIFLTNLIAAIAERDKKGIMFFCKAISELAESHTKEDKLSEAADIANR